MDIDRQIDRERERTSEALRSAVARAVCSGMSRMLVCSNTYDSTCYMVN